jgi:LppP/LprE lipoprotein
VPVRDDRAVPRRDRVIRHSPAATWTGRVLGVIGTVVVLATGAVTAALVISAAEDDEVAAAPAETPAKKQRAEKRKAKPPAQRLTPRQRQERFQAVGELRGQGYAPVSLDDYKVDHPLRVLIGRPVGGTPPGMRAFFFVGGRYIGHDATSPSGKLRAGRQLEREITIVYTLYEEGDRECCPGGGDTRVHFRWTGEALVPREEIPPDYERLVPPT